MAAELYTATTLKPYNLLQPSTSSPSPSPKTLFFTPLRSFPHSKILETQRTRKSTCFTVCVLTEDPKHTSQLKTEEEIVAQKLARKKSQRFTYLIAAVMSSFGVTSMAILAVYYRFSWQMEGSGEVPWSEMFGTFALSVGAAVSLVTISQLGNF